MAARPGAGRTPRFGFHVLRHTGNTLAAATGASTKELMCPMGHPSMRAALIYQHRHATTDRDAAIAVALSQLSGDVDAGGGGRPGHRPEQSAVARPRTGTCRRAGDAAGTRWSEALIPERRASRRTGRDLQ